MSGIIEVFSYLEVRGEGLGFRGEGEKGNLWGSSDTHRHGAAKSDIHVEVMVAISIKTVILII